MTLLLALRVLGTALGAYMLYRAVARRLGRQRSGRVLRRVTHGLWAAGAVGGLMLLGVLYFPSPGWVGRVANWLVIGGMCVLFPLALWIGWQLAVEEELDLESQTTPPDQQDGQVA